MDTLQTRSSNGVQTLAEPQTPEPASSEARAGSQTLLRSGAIVGIGIGLAGVLQSVFHLALARILGPSQYSLLATLLAAVLIATPLTLALQAAVAREVAWRLAHESEAAAGIVLRETLRALLRRGLALLVVLSPLALLVALLVDVRDPVPVIATAATLVGMLLFSIAWGGLQGTHRFVALSAAQCWFAAVKLTAGVAIGLLGAGAGAVMLGVAGAAIVTAAVSALLLRRLWEAGRSLPSSPRRILRGFAGGPAVVLTLFAAVSGMDVLVARLAFTPGTAGDYSAVSFGARAMLVIPLAVTTVLFPRVATMSDTERERRHLLGGLAAVGLIGAVASAVLFVAPETIVRIAFGSAYVSAAPWLGPLAVAMTLFALANVYVYHFLSLGQSQYTILLAGVVTVQIALYALFHDRPVDLIGVLIASAALLLMASELFERRLRGRVQLRRDVQGQRHFVPLRPTAPVHDLSACQEMVSIVIPAYDEASRIEKTLHDTVACMKGLGCHHEILVVDDGSHDPTRKRAERAAAELLGVRVIGYRQNAGKGYAVVQGARAAIGELVLFLDADLEVHPRQLEILYKAMQEAQADIVIGSKMHRGSQVDYPRKRRIMSWGYYALVRFAFGLPVRDTQTGLKLFRGEALDRVVPRMLIKRFAFDLEALTIAHRLGYRIVEAPVVVTREREYPRIGFGDALHIAWDTAAVWYRTYLRRYYDRVPDPAIRAREPSEPQPEALL